MTFIEAYLDELTRFDESEKIAGIGKFVSKTLLQGKQGVKRLGRAATGNTGALSRGEMAMQGLRKLKNPAIAAGGLAAAGAGAYGAKKMME